MERNQAVIDGAEDAILTSTLAGIISSWNPAAEQMFGHSARAMIGTSMHSFAPLQAATEEGGIFERFLKGEKIERFEATWAPADGLNVQLSVAISPLLDATRTLTGASLMIRNVTHRAGLERSARLLCRSLVDTVEDAVIATDLTGDITVFNKGAEQLFGLASAEVVGSSFTRLLAPDERESKFVTLLSVTSGGPTQRYHSSCVRNDGRSFPAAVKLAPILDGDGSVIGASLVLHDVTQELQAQSEARLTESVFTYTSEGIVIVDRAGRIVEVNAAFSRITGYSKADSIGQHPDMFRSSRQGPEVFKALWLCLVRTGEWRGEFWSRRKDGEAYSVMLTVSRVRAARGRVQSYVILISDITPLRLQQEKLEHWAQFDPLTDLPNRWLLSDRLAQAVSNSVRHHWSIAVLYLDLDGFKRINDSYGHSIGDEFLVALSHQMRAGMRDVDTLGRIGGDEFVAVLTDLSSCQDCLQLTERILHACAQPVTIGGVRLAVTASIGLTVFPQDNSEPEVLLRHADQAMYEAKRDGKNKYRLFDAVQDTEFKNRGEHQERVLQALERNEFVLYFQPKVNMRTGQLVGCEALIRWAHPERGLLLPGEFLPDIERHPVSEKLGAWVVDSALQQMRKWHTQGLKICVGINVSARELQQADFTHRLLELIANCPEVRADCVELEILETNALEDIASVSRLIQACHAGGVRFAIDDFGTGYSSLTYLRRLPVDVLKIDKSFVRDMLEDPDDLAIVRGVIGLASAFQRDVIAEGVESEAHGLKLLELGCELAQGYVIAKPMPAEDIEAWTNSWRPFASWRATAAQAERTETEAMAG